MPATPDELAARVQELCRRVNPDLEVSAFPRSDAFSGMTNNTWLRVRHHDWAAGEVDWQIEQGPFGAWGSVAITPIRVRQAALEIIHTYADWAIEKGEADE